MSSMSVGAGNVSIVIPCCNQGVLLREALASIEQVRNEKLLEVIVVDDGSSAVETRTFLSQVEEAGYCVVPQPNSGLDADRNAGFLCSYGEYHQTLGMYNRLCVA